MVVRRGETVVTYIRVPLYCGQTDVRWLYYMCNMVVRLWSICGQIVVRFGCRSERERGSNLHLQWGPICLWTATMPIATPEALCDLPAYSESKGWHDEIASPQALGIPKSVCVERQVRGGQDLYPSFTNFHFCTKHKMTIQEIETIFETIF